jgi:hypothetical protein
MRANFGDEDSEYDLMMTLCCVCTPKPSLAVNTGFAALV